MSPARAGLTPGGRHLWITGGGTREPLDAVRFVGNRSTGRLALRLVDVALARGYSVRALLAEDVTEPSAHAALQVDRFVTSQDLQDLLTRPTDPRPDALIHSAAVSDYAPAPASGKVPSGQDEWVVTFHPLPKVVHAFRERHPDCPLVLFKLEAEVTVEQLQDRARAAARRAGAQWVFANRLEEVGEAHRGWLLPVAGGEPVLLQGREAIAAGILDGLEETHV